RPSLVGAEGLAPAPAAPVPLCGSPKNRREPCGTSWICVTDQPGFAVSVPPVPPESAETLVKLIVPKFVSGTTRQKPKPPHSDGASAIHSAELTSGAAIVSFFVKVVWRVRFFTCTSTLVPLTTTLDVTVSPGISFSFTFTDAAGTSSYQM